MPTLVGVHSPHKTRALSHDSPAQLSIVSGKGYSRASWHSKPAWMPFCSATSMAGPILGHAYPFTISSWVYSIRNDSAPGKRKGPSITPYLGVIILATPVYTVTLRGTRTPNLRITGSVGFLCNVLDHLFTYWQKMRKFVSSLHCVRWPQ